MSQPLGTVVWACRKLPNLLNLDTVVIGQGPHGITLYTHVEQPRRENGDYNRSGRFPTHSVKEDAGNTYD